MISISHTYDINRSLRITWSGAGVSWRGGGQLGCGWSKAAVGTDRRVSWQDTSHTWETPGPGALRRRPQS